jgi:hypothetical protein
MSSAVRTLAQQVPKLARSMKTSSKALAEGGHGGYYYVRAISNVYAFALHCNVAFFAGFRAWAKHAQLPGSSQQEAEGRCLGWGRAGNWRRDPSRGLLVPAEQAQGCLIACGMHCHVLQPRTNMCTKRRLLVARGRALSWLHDLLIMYAAVSPAECNVPYPADALSA